MMKQTVGNFGLSKFVLKMKLRKFDMNDDFRDKIDRKARELRK